MTTHDEGKRRNRLSDRPLSRRTVLKTTGIVALSGTAFSGTAAAQFPQYPVAPESYWGLEKAETKSEGRSTEGLDRSTERDRNRATDGQEE